MWMHGSLFEWVNDADGPAVLTGRENESGQGSVQSYSIRSIRTLFIF